MCIANIGCHDNRITRSIKGRCTTPHLCHKMATCTFKMADIEAA